MQRLLHRQKGWDLVHTMRDLGEEGFSGLMDCHTPSAKARIFWNEGAVVLLTSTDLRLSYAAYLLRCRQIDRESLRACMNEAQATFVGIEDVLLARGLVDADGLARHKAELSMDILERLFATPEVQVGWAELHTAPIELDVRPILYLAAFFKAVRNRADVEELRDLFEERWDFRLHTVEERAGFLHIFSRVFRSGNPPWYLDGGIRVGELLAAEDGDERLLELFALTQLRIAWFHRVEPPEIDPEKSRQVWEQVFAAYGRAP